MADGDLERIFRAFEAAHVRYLVVGGVAVVLHGYPRFTADLDLVLSFEPSNLEVAFEVLRRLGYQPRAPVSLEELAQPKIRRSWVRDKNLVVLSLWSAALPATEIDLFVEEPFPFEQAYARALRAEIGDICVSVASFEDLITLKLRGGRPKDLEDIRCLEQLAREIHEAEDD